MILVVTTQKIEACECYKKFAGFEKTLCVSRRNKEILHTNLVQYKLTGKFLPDTGKNNLLILNELIKQF